MGAPKAVQSRTKQTRKTAIDDTLATVAVFEMTPEQIMKGAADPEGERIGNEVAEKVLRFIDKSGRLPADAAQLD